jgi:hypothetical protein
MNIEVIAIDQDPEAKRAHKDLGKVADQFSADVPSHGVVLITVKR